MLIYVLDEGISKTDRLNKQFNWFFLSSELFSIILGIPTFL